MNVNDVMKRTVYSCRSDETLEAAARLMWDHRVGAIPVLNAGGYVVGMLTDRDVCMGAYTTGRNLSGVGVTQAMSRKVISCHASASLATAEHLMREHQIRRLPVVDEAGRLVGVLSLDDLASHLECSYEGGASRPLGGHAIALTLAATSERPAPRGS